MSVKFDPILKALRENDFDGTLVNLTTRNTISVDQNGNVGTDVATDGAVHIENTGNTGIGLGVYSNMDANVAAPLVSINAANAAFNQQVVLIQNGGVQKALEIIQTGSLGTNNSAFLVQLNSVLDAGAKYGVRVYSNQIHTNGDLVNITNDHASANNVVLRIVNDGANEAVFIDNNGNGAALRIDQTGNGGHFRLTGDTANVGSVDGEIWFDGTDLKINIGGSIFNFDRTAA